MLKKVLVILIVVLLLGAGGLFLSPSKVDSSERIFTSKEISNLKEISLNGDFDVNITTSDSKDIKCSFSKSKIGFVIGDSKFQSNIENDVLYVTKSGTKNLICIGGGETLKLNIDIPKNYKNKLSIKSVLSKVNILNSNSKDIQCDVKDSNIKISLDSICGNIAVNSNLGNIDLKLPKDEKFNLSAKSRLGEITNNLDSNVDSSISEKNILLSSLDGNITISGK